MAQDIKITASMDTASFRTVDSAIKQLIISVDRLNKSMENVARSVNKIQAGGQVGGSVPNLKTPGQGKQNGGIVSAVLGTGDSQGVGRLISEADRAFETVSRKVRTFTDRTMSDVSRLSNSLNSLKPAYADQGWSNRGTAAVGASQQQQMIQFAASRGIPQIIPNLPGASGGAGTPGTGGRGTSGLFGRGSIGLNSFLSGVGNGAEAIASGNVGGFLGSTLGRAGAIGLAGYSGYKMADALTAIGGNVYNANQQFALENPVALQQKLATAVSPFKNMAQAGVSKDYASMIAWQRVFNRPDIMQSVSDVKLNKESIARLMSDRTITGQGKELMSSLQGYIAKHGGLDVSDWVSHEGRSIPDAQLRNIRDVDRQIKQEQLMADQGERLNAAHSAERGKMDVYTELMSNEIGQNYLGRFQTLAVGGRRSGIIHRKGKPDMTAYEYYNAQEMKRGWTQGDYNANYQQLLGIGKGYGSIAGGHTLISAGMAGFGNLGQVIRTAGTVGGTVGAAGDYALKLAQRTIGNGALDVSVGRDLYGDVSKAALATGMYGGANLNWVGSNLAAMTFGGGLDVAGQQNRLYGYEMGNALNKTYTSGSRSNFDRALANEAAMGAAGGFGGASRDLMRLANDPRLLASVAGGAAKPEWLDSSVTKEMASAFQSRLTAGKFADVIDTTWRSDPVTSTLLEEVRANKNDPNTVISKHLSNSGADVGSNKWFKQLRFLTTKLGRSLGGENPQADISMVEEGYLSTLGLTPPKGSGAWRPAMSGLEKIAAEKGAQVELAKGEAGANVGKGNEFGSVDPAGFTKKATGSMDMMTSLVSNFDHGVENFNLAVTRLLNGLGIASYGGPVHAKGPVVKKIQ
jgi:hypothetical protein